MKEEQYEHLEEAEIQKVDKMVGDVMIWMNSKMNQQSKQSLTVDPVVNAAEITAKTKVTIYILVKFFCIFRLCDASAPHTLTHLPNELNGYLIHPLIAFPPS